MDNLNMDSNTNQKDVSSVAHVVLKIGSVLKSDGNTDKLDYDVSSFLSDYDSMGSEWHNKLDNFIDKLDNKVKINVIHKPIADGINGIVDKICANLPKFNKTSYAGIKQYKSGSMYAGLRVGRPYEADVLLETQEKLNDFLRNMYFFEISSIAKMIHIDKWIIHEVRDIRVGVCLVLEYKPNGEEQEGVGVLVDLVLCHTIEGNIESRELNQQACCFLESVNTPIDFHKFRLNNMDEGFDSGYLQHQLLKQLPEGQISTPVRTCYTRAMCRAK